MMSALLFAFNMIFQQGHGMVTRRYGKKHNYGGLFFNAMTCLFSMMFFTVTDPGGFNFTPRLWIYGILSGLMFATGFYTVYVAYSIGSFVLTNIISSFSGVVAILYGILFLHESAGFTTYTGIVLVFLSVILMQYKKNTAGPKRGFSVGWIVCSLLAALSNGFIAIIQKAQQLRFDGACDNEFMIISLGVSFLLMLTLSFVKEREHYRFTARYGALYGFASGAFNWGMNFVNLMLLEIMSISVLTPLKTGVSFLLSFLISVVIYKERFTRLQLVSAAIGVLAIVMFRL